MQGQCLYHVDPPPRRQIMLILINQLLIQLHIPTQNLRHAPSHRRHCISPPPPPPPPLHHARMRRARVGDVSEGGEAELECDGEEAVFESLVVVADRVPVIVGFLEKLTISSRRHFTATVRPRREPSSTTIRLRLLALPENLTESGAGGERWGMFEKGGTYTAWHANSPPQMNVPPYVSDVMTKNPRWVSWTAWRRSATTTLWKIARGIEFRLLLVIIYWVFATTPLRVPHSYQESSINFMTFSRDKMINWVSVDLYGRKNIWLKIIALKSLPPPGSRANTTGVVLGTHDIERHDKIHECNFSKGILVAGFGVFTAGERGILGDSGTRGERGGKGEKIYTNQDKRRIWIGWYLHSLACALNEYTVVRVRLYDEEFTMGLLDRMLSWHKRAERCMSVDYTRLDTGFRPSSTIAPVLLFCSSREASHLSTPVQPFLTTKDHLQLKLPLKHPQMSMEFAAWIRHDHFLANCTADRL
ncbi:hypothetical protein BU17DRAFT_70220 [Hysterangium stoloniferum]|nr:hypothetical protein BU17DRAFT_70220 [Hysterangium stoloniferum]